MAFRPANIPAPLGAAAKPGLLLRCCGRAVAVLVLFLVFVHAAGLSRAQAENRPLQEYQVKAAFLYTITKFVEWPASGSGTSSPTLNIAILGQDPFGENLDTIRGKRVKGRPIGIRHFRRVEEIRDCDVVFVCSQEKKHLGQILKQLQNMAVLTVADQEGFCEAGGMVNLVTSRNRVMIEINLAAARRARLTISSQLLKLSRIVAE